MADNNRKNPQSPLFNRHLWEYTPVREIMGIGVIIGIFWMALLLRDILTPVLIGLLLAYLFSPFIEYASKKWGLPQLVSISFLLTVLLILGGGFVAWLAPVLMDQIINLGHDLPGYLKNFLDRNEIQSGSLTNQLTDMADRIGEDPVSTLHMVFRGTNQAVSFMGIVISTTAYLIISFMLVPIYFFFFAWQLASLKTQLKEYLPASHKNKTLHILSRMDETIGKFFRGRLVVAVIMAFLFAVGWWFTNVPYWFLLGVGTGILSLIPYAATLGWPVAILLKYLDMTTGQGSPDFDWMAVFLWPSVVYIVVQVFEGWVLTPWIQSESTDLSAGTILLAVLIGGDLAGIYGLILAIPLTACLKIFLQEMVLPPLKRWAKAN
jgi:predicted PurR-regulated permease PerM